ncbi:hypothetical protein ACVWW5_006860 [Bradyrhizobium sp. LM3.4]
MLAAMIVWADALRGSATLVAPILLSGGEPPRPAGNFAQGSPGGKFRCLIPLADFPRHDEGDLI